MDGLELQVRVSKILGLAFALSITGVGGIGSLMAFILGLKALRTIGRAQVKINGRVLAWWCILVGGLGTLSIPSLIVLSIISTPK